MDKLLAMKMFVATVDAQGFSAAARQLGLATSSVTRLVDALEAALGATLLNRSTRQVSLTEAGARYYERARGIFEALDEADASVADRGEEPVGVLRLCLPVEFGRRVIAPHLGPFLAQHPALELDIDLSDRLDDLLDGRYDLSIRLGDPSPNDELVCRQLGRFQRWLVASPGYLAGRDALEHPRQLLEHACLRFRYGQKGRPWRLARGQDSLELDVSGPLRSANADMLRETALAGSGIALLADWLVREDVAAGRLQRLFPDWQASPGAANDSINALYLPNHRGSRRVNAFIDFCENLLQRST
ncbi:MULTISPECIES: LysR family transcriptional regulator [Pseudomonas]|uniref:LysR family transcriptional regulator n=2 Tax=Pseudomonas TaxID=286 RepID=A0A3M8T6M4_PSEPU|nr:MULTISPECIES: LysR family transcriptional regulator [Pseudomonas]MCO6689607.1 LysR family transcriptional regulator [Pseudomonas shirazica]KIC81237.1 LysR family transcriptional regulator [Pseudomonas sp. C5pp]MBA6112782.1 LysR family transcriptional regulator [Pseudomonas asiatica]MCE0849102.1 LysR family transcriptional regulator [Pseudomonas asiatica]MDZ5737767.1 LysR family transcriptional regulator [Pseudomonas asiatica]